mmetsp:Transcript_12910/g.16596  ORF Transcript_12910/g.16596 Transcript_12910/m.16596 type:complete len:260 (+) Transcript_12910:124-903(+)
MGPFPSSIQSWFAQQYRTEFLQYTSRRQLSHISLYKGHYPTNPLQRIFLTAYSAVSALNDPEKGEMVATLGEVTGEIALKRLKTVMLNDPEGAKLLQDKPEINEQTVDLQRLSTLPLNTFGRAYSDFMGGHGFSPDSRTPVRFVDDEELAYIMLRYRQVHDFWHVLSGLPPTVVGEITLKWVELLQTGLPVCALSAAFGPLSLTPDERTLLRQRYLPWALRTGRRVKPLINVHYEKYFETPLEDFRNGLGMQKAPDMLS